MSIQGRTKGLFITDGPDGRTEHETFTCCHCNRPQVVPHRAHPDECGGFCRCCMAMTCKSCASKGECAPFMKKLEAYEKRAALRASIGL